MKLLLERIKSDRDTTIGVLYRDGVFDSFTVEDEARTVKVMGETRIPAGEYRIELRIEGGMTQRYAARYPDIHRGMLWLRDVPGFTFIYIHVGNTDDDTAGCVLVGQSADSARMTIGASTMAYKRLYEAVVDAAADGELSIEIVDRDQS